MLLKHNLFLIVAVLDCESERNGICPNIVVAHFMHGRNAEDIRGQNKLLAPIHVPGPISTQRRMTRTRSESRIVKIGGSAVPSYIVNTRAPRFAL